MRLLVGQRELEVPPRPLQLLPGRLVPRVRLLLTKGAHQLGHVPRRVVPRRAREHRRGKGGSLLRQLRGGNELLVLHGTNQRRRKVPPRGQQASGRRRVRRLRRRRGARLRPLDEPPLHHGAVVPADRDAPLAAEQPAHAGDVRSVAGGARARRARRHAREAEEAHAAPVVRHHHQRAVVRRVRRIDVGGVEALLPDAHHWPAQRAAPPVPLRVLALRRAHLPAAPPLPVQDLVRVAVALQQRRVARPVELRHLRAVPTAPRQPRPPRHVVQIDRALHVTHSQRRAVGRPRQRAHRTAAVVQPRLQLAAAAARRRLEDLRQRQHLHAAVEQPHRKPCAVAREAHRARRPAHPQLQQRTARLRVPHLHLGRVARRREQPAVNRRAGHTVQVCRVPVHHHRHHALAAHAHHVAPARPHQHAATRSLAVEAPHRRRPPTAAHRQHPLRLQLQATAVPPLLEGVDLHAHLRALRLVRPTVQLGQSQPEGRELPIGLRDRLRRRLAHALECRHAPHQHTAVAAARQQLAPAARQRHHAALVPMRPQPRHHLAASPHEQLAVRRTAHQHAARQHRDAQHVRRAALAKAQHLHRPRRGLAAPVLAAPQLDVFRAVAHQARRARAAVARHLQLLLARHRAARRRPLHAPHRRRHGLLPLHRAQQPLVPPVPHVHRVQVVPPHARQQLAIRAEANRSDAEHAPVPQPRQLLKRAHRPHEHQRLSAHLPARRVRPAAVDGQAADVVVVP